LLPKKQKNWGPSAKGRLMLHGGRTIASGITLEEARARFPDYRVVADRGTRDALDGRLPGSYGSRQ
jgi:hypothetical protein